MKVSFYFCLSGMCFLVAFLLLMSGVRRQEEALAARIAPAVLRFHVLANSDSPEDQAIKLQVKDLLLKEIREGAARASSIAEAAGVSRSTVTSTLKALKSMGYVDYEPYSLVHLTEAGMHIGRDIAHRHIVIQEFFQHILQLEPNVSNDVACELEHVIPPDVIRRLGQFVLYLRSREDDWKNWQEDYKEIRLEHIQSNTDRDLVRNAPPMLAMRTQMMGQDELRKKYR